MPGLSNGVNDEEKILSLFGYFFVIWFTLRAMLYALYVF